jgi:hypothetical protein
VSRPRPNGALQALPARADPLAALVDVLAEQLTNKILERLGPTLGPQSTNDDELLSYQQVADLLTTTEPPSPADVKRPTAEYVATLVARGDLVGTPLPGKYRRVRRGDYREFIAQRRRSGVDHEIYPRYTEPRDRRPTPTPTPDETQLDASRTRQAPRGHGDVGGPVGARRTRDVRDRRSLHPSPSGGPTPNAPRPRRPRRATLDRPDAHGRSDEPT